jgi:hypothetical protein
MALSSIFFNEHPVNSTNIYRQFHFGDPATEMGSDPYGCLIAGDYGLGSFWAESNQTTGQITTSLAAQSGHYFARLYTQIGGAVGAAKQGSSALGGTAFGGAGLLGYPAPHNNGLYVSPVFVTDGVVLRAQLKALWQPLHTRPLGHGGLVAAVSSPIGRRLYAVATGYSATTPGETFIDVDGPWR